MTLSALDIFAFLRDHAFTAAGRMKGLFKRMG